MPTQSVPDDFQFSQASLQDYVDCRRRFQLRYLIELAWPAVEAEPVEKHEAHLQQGEAFHRLVHQHQLGLPLERLASVVQAAQQGLGGEGRLAEWWDHYLRIQPFALPAMRYVEITLSAPVNGHRLIAKYDLIAVEPGQRAVIVDWKTSQGRPTRAWLAARLQTRVYRCLLVQAGAHLNAGHSFQPEQVEMIYWFANFPDQPERFAYDGIQYQADTDYLAALIAEIKHSSEDAFPLTDDVRKCRFCPYRSLCDRGVEAGNLDTADPETVASTAEEKAAAWEASFDFEQIAEIQY